MGNHVAELPTQGATLASQEQQIAISPTTKLDIPRQVPLSETLSKYHLPACCFGHRREQRGCPLHYGTARERIASFDVDFRLDSLLNASPVGQILPQQIISSQIACSRYFFITLGCIQRVRKRYRKSSF